MSAQLRSPGVSRGNHEIRLSSDPPETYNLSPAKLSAEGKEEEEEVRNIFGVDDAMPLFPRSSIFDEFMDR